MPEKSAFAASN